MWHFGYRIPKSVTYYLNGLFFALETDWGMMMPPSMFMLKDFNSFRNDETESSFAKKLGSGYPLDQNRFKHSQLRV